MTSLKIEENAGTAPKKITLGDFHGEAKWCEQVAKWHAFLTKGNGVLFHGFGKTPEDAVNSIIPETRTLHAKTAVEFAELEKLMSEPTSGSRLEMKCGNDRLEASFENQSAMFHFVDGDTNPDYTFSTSSIIRLRDWLNALPLPKDGFNATDAIGQNVPVVPNGSDPMSMTTRFALLVDRVITLEREANDAASLHADLCERVKTLEAAITRIDSNLNTAATDHGTLNTEVRDLAAKVQTNHNFLADEITDIRRSVVGIEPGDGK